MISALGRPTAVVKFQLPHTCPIGERGMPFTWHTTHLGGQYAGVHHWVPVVACDTGKIV